MQKHRRGGPTPTGILSEVHTPNYSAHGRTHDRSVRYGSFVARARQFSPFCPQRCFARVMRERSLATLAGLLAKGNGEGTEHQWTLSEAVPHPSQRYLRHGVRHLKRLDFATA